MSYVCDIRYNIMNKADKFDESLQELARLAKVISHPARLAILKYLAETRTCISGDISDYIPLSRTTVSQHLKELRNAGFIKGEIDGLKMNYCLNVSTIEMFYEIFEQFIKPLRNAEVIC
jgi:ArsR family transcriptional regulator, arsenate/arsenite/antimonite-responsive transcriptional repressor